ncbi:MAG: WD40 repeat domain-containing protein [Actinoplanes sp.]
MDPRFTWDEDVAVAPHRVLRVPFEEDRFRSWEFTDSVVAEVTGRTVLAGPRLGPDNRAVLGAFDLESGALRPDRSGLRDDPPNIVRLGAGELLAVLGPRETIIIRDAATGNLVREIPAGPGTSRFALGAVDGRPAVFASTFAGVCTWDVATGEPVAAPRELQDGYTAGDFYAEHDGRTLVMGYLTGGTMRFFDALTGEAFGAPFHGHAERRAEWLAAVSYQGRLIIASRQDLRHVRPILLWDAETGAAVLNPPPVLPVEALSVSESHSLALVDGRPLLLLGRPVDAGRPLLLWDPVAGCEVLPDFFAGYDQDPDKVVLGALDSGFYAVVVGRRPRRATLWVAGPDGERRGIPIGNADRITLGRVGGRPTVVLAGGEGSLQLVDVETRQQNSSPRYGGPMRQTVAAGTVAGRSVAVICGSPTRVWDLETGVPVARLDRFSAHSQGFAIGRLDGRDVLAVVTETELAVWDFAADAARTKVDGSFEARIGVVFTEVEGRVLVTAHATDADGVRAVRSWDAATGEPAGRPYRLEMYVEVLAAGRVGDRPVVFVGSDRGPIIVVDPVTGAAALPPLTGHGGRVGALTYGSFDGRAVLVSGSRDHTVRVWDAATGAPVGRPFTGHRAEIASVHLVAYQGEPVVVSTAKTGEPRMWMLRAAPLDPGHTGRVNTLAGGFRAGVPVFASGAEDLTVRLWDTTTGRPVGAPLTGHDGPVTGVVFAGPQRDVLVSVDRTGLVLRWPAHPGAPRAQPLARLNSTVVSLATTVVDGRDILAAATVEGRIELVDATSGEPYATLSTGTSVSTVDLGLLDGRLVALAVSPHPEFDQGSVTVWDVRSGEPLHRSVVVPEQSDTLGAFGVVDGRLVIVQGIDAENDDEGEGYWEGYGSHLNVYDAATRAILARIELSSSWNYTVTVAGAVALIGTAGGGDNDGVYVTDLRTGAEIGPLYQGHGPAGVLGVATVEVDGRVLVASSDDGNAVHIWDLENRTRRLA